MIAGVATVACLFAAALVAFLALECLLGVAGRSHRVVPANPPAFTVLMPAHDEAQGIARAVQAVMAQLRVCDSLLVVADNCSDDTAAVARSLGATVIERADPDLRGKGYALEFGRAWLLGKPGDVVIIVDADCIPAPGALARLAATGGAVVQGAYLLMPRPGASPKVGISCFAFMIKNQVRQHALHRLSGVALLQGSGMAFPRAIFDRVQWRTDSLVEDLDMGLDLVLAGDRVVFDGSAVFFSDASSEAGTAGQRRRWEHGMLHSMAVYVPALFRQALFRKGLAGRGRLAFVGLDLMIPPTVMLIAAALLALAAGAAILGLTLPVWTLVLSLALLAVGLLRAWQVHGREILPLRSLLEVPAYMIWKLPIIARFFTRRETQWVRTERES